MFFSVYRNYPIKIIHNYARLKDRDILYANGSGTKFRKVHTPKFITTAVNHEFSYIRLY